MSKQALALALCRVSTVEQLQNNSLNRQKDSVIRSAAELEATIPDDGWWSGSVSSKRGTNVNRKDLQEIVERCKKDRRIKYIIVDEPDRFMRSIDEAAFFEVTFRELGVTVWYASDPELNKGDLASKLLKFTKYLSAEGSNEERQRKSISGQTKALMEGRYTFSPKPGYRRGYERGIQEIDETRGPALQEVLVRLATQVVTPSQALVELNKSDFMKNHALYKMDKFRKIVTDPFYAGIVEINKQVQVRNENGLHKPLITKQQHEAILRIMNDKRRNQSGPRKNGNPKYPISNLLTCTKCISESSISRYVGFDHSNGKPNGPTYEKYRCRACNHYMTREEVHSQVEKHFKQNPVTQDGVDDLLEALRFVWKENEGQAEQESNRIEHRIQALKQTILNQSEAAIDPSNAAIKDEILQTIAKRKQEVAELEDELEGLSSHVEYNKVEFLRFGYGFVQNMGSNFLVISQANRLRCKDIVFPAGFYADESHRVYTPEISPLITLLPKKKSTEVLENSHLVRVRGL
jgi:DNA invertase Pin-like site-specific DNA recombinase